MRGTSSSSLPARRQCGSSAFSRKATRNSKSFLVGEARFCRGHRHTSGFRVQGEAPRRASGATGHRRQESGRAKASPSRPHVQGWVLPRGVPRLTGGALAAQRSEAASCCVAQRDGTVRAAPENGLRLKNARNEPEAGGMEGEARSGVEGAVRGAVGTGEGAGPAGSGGGTFAEMGWS